MGNGGRFVPGDSERARAGGLARWENDARRRAELPALRAENVQLHAALAAIGAALVEHADDDARAVAAVRGLLGRLADRRPIAAASDEAALRAVYMLTLSESGTPSARLLHVRALVQAALGDRLTGGGSGSPGA
jgi:hypothetical protein